mmetsp:Transcript_10672/g.23475  ORF Transcript_10672/g.23475 Transcript_10672/m.23475 type:complete len:118 (-) Transcript_10672:247-600(-)
MLQGMAWVIRSSAKSIMKLSAGQLIFGQDMIVDEPTIAKWENICSQTSDQQVRERGREKKGWADYEYVPGNKVLIVKKSTERRKKVYKNGTLRIIRGGYEKTIHIRRVSTYIEQDPR